VYSINVPLTTAKRTRVRSGLVHSADVSGGRRHSMELFETPAGAMTFWQDGTWFVRVVAGDADRIRVFLRARDEEALWRVLGSPDQRQETFVAASKAIPAASLDKLSSRGISLLPEHGRWEEIGIDALNLFTNDILAMCR
jgi:hypothetical protein